MKKIITVDNLVSPFSKGSVNRMKFYLRELDIIYKNKIVDNEGFKVNPYIISENEFVIISKVPSDVNSLIFIKKKDKIYYDIILHIIKSNENVKRGQDAYIDNWPVLVYNNSLSFIYQFNYVFGKRNSLVQIRGDKMFNKESLKEKPKIRNPQMLTGIDKSIYFVHKYLKSKGFLKVQNLIRESINDTEKFEEEIKNLMTQDEMIEKRRKTQKIISNFNKEERKKYKKKNKKFNSWLDRLNIFS